MNAAHVHLLLNHVPVIVTIVGGALLAFAMISRNDQLVRPSLGLLVIAALTTVPVFRSGEAAEDVVEHRPEVSETIIDRHEDAAKLAAAAIGVLGVIGCYGLLAFHRRARVPDAFTFAVVVLSLAVALLLGRAANLGGQIRHAEIRSPERIYATGAQRDASRGDD